MDFITITNRIDSLLKDKHLFQKDLCQHIGISVTAYGHWKSGRNTATLENLEKIAEFLGVSLKWLMFGDDDDIKNAPAVSGEGDDLCKLSADEWELIAAYRDLNDEGQADARKQLFVMQQSGIYKKHHSSAMVSGK